VIRGRKGGLERPAEANVGRGALLEAEKVGRGVRRGQALTGTVQVRERGEEGEVLVRERGEGHIKEESERGAIDGAAGEGEKERHFGRAGKGLSWGKCGGKERQKRVKRGAVKSEKDIAKALLAKKRRK